ncbi:hypothetical protein, partial [Bacillus anthracis]|uniref:hypothetical protein n=1 Tax=Bacillus anthracis TaxID=1392 RepID=UPI000E116702
LLMCSPTKGRKKKNLHIKKLLGEELTCKKKKKKERVGCNLKYLETKKKKKKTTNKKKNKNKKKK